MDPYLLTVAHNLMLLSQQSILANRRNLEEVVSSL